MRPMPKTQKERPNDIARGIDIQQINMVVNYDLPLMNDQATEDRPDT